MGRSLLSTKEGKGMYAMYAKYLGVFWVRVDVGDFFSQEALVTFVELGGKKMIVETEDLSGWEDREAA